MRLYAAPLVAASGFSNPFAVRGESTRLRTLRCGHLT
jgi:hypothetical protein